MRRVSYDQIANYEATLELINTLRGIFLSLSKDKTKYKQQLIDRAFEIGKEKQQIEPTDDFAIADIRATYAPLVQSYYNDPKAFVVTESFVTIKSNNEQYIDMS